MSKKRKVTIALDQVRQIKFSVNAMVELEERFGKSITNIFEEGNVGFALIVAVMRIGLIHGGMKIPGTPKNQELFVGDLIQEHWIDEDKGLDMLMDIIMQALDVAGIFALNKPEEDEANPKQDTAEEETPPSA